MSRKRLAVLLLSSTTAYLLPMIALAAGALSSSGLVPCGASSIVDSATECQACNLIQLIQGVISFLIGLSIPLSVAMFAFAGILYFTSAANEHGIDRAKKIFRSTLVGFVIAITAWLIVNTVLFTILDKQQYPNSTWFHIDCTQNRQVASTVKQLFDNTLGISDQPLPVTAFNDFTTQGATLSCPDGFVPDPVSKTHCIKPSDPTQTAPYIMTMPAPISGGRSQSQLQGMIAGTNGYSSQIASACQNSMLPNCTVLTQAIMANESSGNTYALSGAGAAGLMQVLPSTARSLDPSLAGLSDSQITARLESDTNLNISLGVQYLSQLNSQFGNNVDNVIAGYNGGAKANTASATCPNLTFWQCSANSGYAETRAYVPSVINAMNIIQNK